jgi:general secretion pathway protein L
MQERLLVLLATDGRALEWMNVAADGRQRARGIGAPPSSGTALTGLLAAPALSVRWLNAPQRGRDKWRGAARYALEDTVADDLEALHITLPARFEAGPVPVAVVRSDWFGQWLAGARQRGLALNSVVPVAALLEPPHRVTIDGLTTLRQAGVGCTIEPELLAFTPTDPGLELEDIADPLSWAAQRLGVVAPPDLLSGAFADADVTRAGGGLWRFAAIALVLALTLELATRVLDVRRLRAQEVALEAEAEQILKTALGPNTVRIPGSERVQLQNEINRRASGAGSAGLIGLLSDIAPVLASESRIKLKGLEYRGQRLELALEGGDVRSFDELRERLLSVPGLKSETGDLNYGKATVTGRIWVERTANAATEPRG